MNFYAGGEGLDGGVELLQFTWKGLDSGPPRADAGYPKEELPRSYSEKFEIFLKGFCAHGVCWERTEASVGLSGISRLS